jgi:hypothetical protein
MKDQRALQEKYRSRTVETPSPSHLWDQASRLLGSLLQEASAAAGRAAVVCGRRRRRSQAPPAQEDRRRRRRTAASCFSPCERERVRNCETKTRVVCVQTLDGRDKRERAIPSFDVAAH